MICIYKIRHIEDINDENIYIGRSLRFGNRKSQHKQFSRKGSKSHLKLYKYIEDNGGIENFVFEIIQELNDNNKHLIADIEREYIDIYKPSLNSNNNKCIVDCSDIKNYMKEYAKIKFKCLCGKEISRANKSKHLKSKYHLNALKIQV